MPAHEAGAVLVEGMLSSTPQKSGRFLCSKNPPVVEGAGLLLSLGQYFQSYSSAESCYSGKSFLQRDGPMPGDRAIEGAWSRFSSTEKRRRV